MRLLFRLAAVLTGLLLICVVAATIIHLTGPEYEFWRSRGVGDSVALTRALEKYHADRGAYPDRLESLVSNYTSGLTIRRRQDTIYYGIGGFPDEVVTWTYEKVDGGYELGFETDNSKDAHPGMLCAYSSTYRSKTDDWLYGGMCE